jgi:Rieske Fe-S protein
VLAATGVALDRLSPDMWTPTAPCYVVPQLGGSEAFLRLSSDRGRVLAVEARCTHLGCPVRYVAQAREFVCPCHGGVFDFVGKPIGGPPKRPLPELEVTVKHGHVYIVDPKHGEETCE